MTWEVGSEASIVSGGDAKDATYALAFQIRKLANMALLGESSNMDGQSHIGPFILETRVELTTPRLPFPRRLKGLIVLRTFVPCRDPRALT